MVGLLWTSDQLVADTSTWQHTTLTTDKYPCPRWDSNPRSQQVSGRRPGACIFVCCECRVLSGRGVCDELITRPEESYLLWCVVCDLETSRIGAPYIYIYIYDISSLRVKVRTVECQQKTRTGWLPLYSVELCVQILIPNKEIQTLGNVGMLGKDKVIFKHAWVCMWPHPGGRSTWPQARSHQGRILGCVGLGTAQAFSRCGMPHVCFWPGIFVHLFSHLLLSCLHTSMSCCTVIHIQGGPRKSSSSSVLHVSLWYFLWH